VGTRKNAKGQRTLEWLEPEELRALLSQLDRYFRVMVFLGAATRLRRSELLGLKWETLSSRASKSRFIGTLLAIANRCLEETRAHGSNSRRRTSGLETTKFLQSTLRLSVREPSYQRGKNPYLTGPPRFLQLLVRKRGAPRRRCRSQR
jgi:integrase